MVVQCGSSFHQGTLTMNEIVAAGCTQYPCNLLDLPTTAFRRSTSIDYSVPRAFRSLSVPRHSPFSPFITDYRAVGRTSLWSTVREGGGGRGSMADYISAVGWLMSTRFWNGACGTYAPARFHEYTHRGNGDAGWCTDSEVSRYRR